ncbi:MAG: hypothetical protein ABR912_16850 [Terracidiphilus sp.]
MSKLVTRIAVFARSGSAIPAWPARPMHGGVHPILAVHGATYLGGGRLPAYSSLVAPSTCSRSGLYSMPGYS